jgi:uncharacterized YigZ family protein
MTVANSRFIATLTPVFTVEQAKSFISTIRQEFADATHNVPAYLIGGGDSVIAHCSDDGEPSGTAGRPALAVLRGSGFGDIAVIVTRYFGGTKLGTGGLVRAYSDAVRLVVDVVPRAEKVTTHIVMITLPYRLFEKVRQVIATHHGLVIDESFSADVSITAQFPVDAFPTFQEALQELSAGSLQAEVVETRDLLMPIK